MRVTSLQFATSLKLELDRLGRPNTPSIRTVRRRYSALLASEPASTVDGVANRLLKSGLSYGRFVAYELVANHEAAFHSLSQRRIMELGRGMADWAAVDCFACIIAGPAWRSGHLSSATIHSWAHSADRWWRRAALVATVPLNVKAQGGLGAPSRTLAVCRLLIHDRDPVVVKALSWALRALAAPFPHEVTEFLRTHEGLAPLVIREVSSKLKTGRKR